MKTYAETHRQTSGVSLQICERWRGRIMRARGTKDITQNPTKSVYYFNIVILFLKINELMNGKLALRVNVDN